MLGLNKERIIRMKTILLSILASCLLFFSAMGQDKTDEKKWTIDPETGDTIYTEAVIPRILLHVTV